MKNNNDFFGSYWLGIPAALYEDKNFSGRLETQVAYFRHVFELQHAGTLRIHISASSRYRLYVNGHSLLSGPCKGDKWRHYYETIDVSPYLKTGNNILAVKVVAYPPFEAQHQNGEGQGPMFSNNSAAGPCLVVSGEVEDDISGDCVSVKTGEARWDVHLDDAIEWVTPHLSLWMGAMEVVHAGRLPAGWQSDLQPSGRWMQAEIRWGTQSNKYGEIFPFPLKKRPIPLLYEKEIQFCGEMTCRRIDINTFTFSSDRRVTIAPHCKVQIELDAGVLTTAYVSLKVQGGQGAKIILKYAECYANEDSSLRSLPEDQRNTADVVEFLEKGDRCDSLHYDFIGHADTYYPSGGEQEYCPFWFRAFRFMRMEIYTDEQAVTIEKPILTETGYPLEFTTEFHSSNQSLMKSWDISKRTLQRCMHETYEDCPYYEQMQYTMDTRLQIIFTYALCGDTRMARRTIEDYQASMLPEGILQSRYPVQAPQVIPMFALHWIFMLEDYYLQTNDVSIPRRYRPTVDAVLDWYERYIGSSGLVEHMDYWQQIDWVEEWDEQAGTPNASLVGPSSIHNFEYAYAMKIAARINRITGRQECAQDYERKAEQILALLEQTCWDEQAGLYMEGPGFKEYSQHAQVWAVLAGAAEGEKARSILIKALDQEGLAKCSFPLIFYFIRALEKVGLYSLMTKFLDTLYEFIVLNVTTIPETPFKPRSECHAWGAFPLYEFPRCLLGVCPGSPGWKTILIRPQLIDIQDCGGTVFTPKGNVQVAWERTSNGVKIWGDAPDGVLSTVILPDGRTEELLSGGAFEYEVALAQS